ncbi:MAG: serine hydrolase [Lachnospiraceae bacterium]|nr:serine hydrolase [Lachnospiraceae bacterium]
MFCRKCGAALRDTDRFCSQCGAPAKAAKAEEKLPDIKENGARDAFDPFPWSAADEDTEDKLFEPERRKPPVEAVRRETPSGSKRWGQPVPPMPKEQVIEFEEEQKEKPQEILYDERLYRDSFLKKREEKSHAVLVTITVLLVIAVLTVAVLVIYFFVNRNNTSVENVGSEIQIIADGNQASGQEGQIAGATESSGENGVDGAGQGAGTQTDASGQAVDGAGQAAGAQTDASGQAVDGAGQVAGAQTDASGQAVDGAGQAAGAQTETAAAAQVDNGTGTAIDVSKIEQLFSAGSGASKNGVYIYDLKNGQTYGEGSSEEAMYASALIAVPILYTAAVRMDQGTVTLNDQITYVNSIGGRGEAYPEEKDGQNYPLSYYLTTMMSYSDNNCMNCLIDYFGLDVINSTCQSAGFTSVDLQRKIVDEVTDGKDNYISAKDLAGMVRELYRGTYQTIGSEFIRQYLKIDSGDGYRTVIGLAPDIPVNAMFLNQNGRGDTRYNEVAVIADDSCEYIISIMCSGDSGFEYETAVTDISNYVYQSLSQI